MRDVIFLAWRYLIAQRFQTMILTVAVALTLAIPAGLWVVSQQGEQSLTARARSTPVLVGARGSPLELVLNSLYYRTQIPARMMFSEVQSIQQSGLALPIPLYVRFRSQDQAIVGTTIDYFRIRNLRLVEGTLLQRLGDCVIGSEVARRRLLHAGDHLTSTPEQSFDVGGVYPLRMRVVGIFARTGTPDDEAIFVDVKTAWIIEGLGHGHQDLAEADIAPAAVLSREKSHVTAKGGGVPSFQEVTDTNIDSFHFHGEIGTFPITGVIAVPIDEKSATRLIGRYQLPEGKLQAVEPKIVIDDLLRTVISVKTYALTAFAVIGFVTLLLLVLIQVLSLRLRARERLTLLQIGGSRSRIRGILIAETMGVLSMGLILATGFTLLIARFGTQIVNYWLTRT